MTKEAFTSCAVCYTQLLNEGVLTEEEFGELIVTSAVQWDVKNFKAVVYPEKGESKLTTDFCSAHNKNEHDITDSPLAEVVDENSGNNKNPQIDNDKEIFENTLTIKDQFVAINEIAREYYSNEGIWSTFGSNEFSEEDRILLDVLLQADETIGWAQKKSYLYDYLNYEGFSDELILKSNLVYQIPIYGKTNERDPFDAEKYYIDSFKDKYMIPLYSVEGKVVGFQGVTRGKFEDINILKSKSLIDSETYVYGLNFIEKEAEYIVVCQHVVDCLMFRSAGIENAVSVIDTNVTTAKVRLISKYTNTVYLCFDLNDSGYEAMCNALIEFVLEGKKVYLINTYPYDRPVERIFLSINMDVLFKYMKFLIDDARDITDIVASFRSSIEKRYEKTNQNSGIGEIIQKQLAVRLRIQIL